MEHKCDQCDAMATNAVRDAIEMPSVDGYREFIPGKKIRYGCADHQVHSRDYRLDGSIEERE